MINIWKINRFVSACCLILILSSCTNKQENPIEQTLFETFLDSLPEIELPCQFSSRDFRLSDYTIPELHQFDSIREEGGIPLGKFYLSDTIVGIIYSFPADILIPVLYTYTVNGESISSLMLLNNYGWSPDCERTDFVVINHDFSIESMDTTYKYFSQNPDSTITNNQLWQIKPNGLIQH